MVYNNAETAAQICSLEQILQACSDREKSMEDRLQRLICEAASTAALVRDRDMEDNRTFLQQIHQTMAQAIRTSGDCFVDVEERLYVTLRQRHSVRFILCRLCRPVAYYFAARLPSRYTYPCFIDLSFSRDVYVVKPT